jgi:uncharacterized protein (TIGR02996 family)
MARKRSPSRPPGHAGARAALFAGVKEAPDDDAQRLVLADWLEEHGDKADAAHAQLIRAQCEYLRLAANLIDPERPEPLHALFRSAGPSILPDYFAPITTQDKRIVSLQRQDQVLARRFGGGQGGSLKELSWEHHCHWHRGFAFLKLYDTQFWDREMTAFATSPAGARAEDLGLKVTPDDCAQVARNAVLAHAAGLEVSESGLDRKDWTTLFASRHLASLCRLRLPWCLADPANIAALARAPQRGRLTHLNLRHNRFGPEHFRTLAAGKFPALEVLHLGGNHLRPKGAQALARLPFLSHLRELDLTNCALGDSGLKAVVSSSHFRCPALLDMGHNRIGRAGMRALLRALDLERLVVLEARSNSLDDKAVAELAGSPRLAGLLHLDISKNAKVGPAGAEALAASPHLKRLASLDLYGCPIGEVGARALLRSPHLRRLVLTIDKGELSAGTLAALRKRYFVK